MGFDKALVRIDGEGLAARTGRLLAEIADPAFEVGPGHSGLPVAREFQPGDGPLGAILSGWVALHKAGHRGPALVLSTDLARLDAATLLTLRDWPGEHSVIPLLDGEPQPLCARWSADDLDAVSPMFRAGERSMKRMLERPGIELTDALPADGLSDADTPDQLDALGLSWARP
jgi:molybdopterin-guanine dinucleotide biosynthesis protein A